MFQTLSKQGRTCLEGYGEIFLKEKIEGALDVLTLLFYRTQYYPLAVRDGCDPSPGPELRQTRGNRESGK
jgi:hypothetical protein